MRATTALPALALVALLPVAGLAEAAITEVALPAEAKQPLAVLADASGKIWVTLDETWAVGRFDPATQRLDIARLGTQKAGQGDSLIALAIGPDGAVWTGSAAYLHRVEPSNMTVRSFALPAPSQLGGGVAVDAAGKVWYASVTNDRLFGLDPSTGKMDNYATPQAFGPLHFDRAPSGLIVSGTYADTYAKVDTATGRVTAGRAGLLDSPVGVGHDATSLWFAEMGGSSVSRVDPGTGAAERFPTTPSPYYPVSGPSSVLVGRDGAVWFVEHFADRISRLDVANRTLHELEVPSSPGTNMQHLAEAPDGAIWFAEWSTHKLGQVAYEPRSPAFTVPERITVARGATQRLAVALPGDPAFGSPDANLTARYEAGAVVLDATKAAPGVYNVLVSSKFAPKEWLGRYVTVTVEDAPKGAPAPEAALVLLALVALAWRRRPR